MGNIRTHYDNLKVERNASYEEIRLAYKKLAQKHHPDKNLNNPDSTRVMAIINLSYSILSDENNRKLHDQWIKEQENDEQHLDSKNIPNKKQEPTNSINIHGVDGLSIIEVLDMVKNGARFVIFEEVRSFILISQKNSSEIYFIRSTESHMKYANKHIFKTLLLGWWSAWGLVWTLETLIRNIFGGRDVTDIVLDSYGYKNNEKKYTITSTLKYFVKTIVVLVIISAYIFYISSYIKNETHTSNSSKTNYHSDQSAHDISKVQPSVYVRPTKAPNGRAWPTMAGYVNGFKKLHFDGLSKVTIDNSLNDSDVFIKLVSINSKKTYPIRVFFIPAYSQFTVNKVRAGLYDIRYRDLDSGIISKSESFNLQEIETYDGIEYSNFTMTLYKTQNGNMRTYALSENEF